MPGRRRTKPRPRTLHISIPEDVVVEVDQRLYDPFKGKTLYGGYAVLVTALLRLWLENPSIIPMEIVEEKLS